MKGFADVKDADGVELAAGLVSEAPEQLTPYALEPGKGCMDGYGSVTEACMGSSEGRSTRGVWGVCQPWIVTMATGSCAGNNLPSQS